MLALQEWSFHVRSRPAPTTLTIQPPETVEKLISMWRLPRTTAQPITQIILNPPSQQRATDTDRFLQSGAASTITYGTPPKKLDMSAFKTPEREVHEYQITHVGPGMVAVKEHELRVQPKP